MNVQCYTDNVVIYYHRFVQYEEELHKTTDSSEIKCFESVPDTSTKDISSHATIQQKSTNRK